MVPLQHLLVIPFSKFNLDDRPEEAKQTDPTPHSMQNGSTREARFNLLRASGIIDENGIANPSYMRAELQPTTDAAKVNICNAVNLDISPKKDTKAIPQWKMEKILPIFQRLSGKYGNLFPFYFGQGQDAHTVYFKNNFSFEKLISYLNTHIPIDKEIEMIGSGVATMLGPDYYLNQINAWLGLPQVPPKQYTPINDYDFWIQTDSLEKVEEAVIHFLLYSLPCAGQIAPEDIADFRYLIHELACKNICSINGEKTIISFSNDCGPDFDCTFSKNKMQQPFAFCNGLIIGIPTDFNVCKVTAPYVAKEVNPAQCIADQFIGLLNGPSVYEPEPRVNWILSKWTNGKWLFSTPWQEAIVKTNDEIKFDHKDQQPSQTQFIKMAEAINRFLLMRKMGCLEESVKYFRAFSKALMEHTVYEEDVAYHLLFSLFHRFSDPIKGLYYLYLISLYTLPLEKASPLSAEFSRNGSFDCLSLKIGFKDISRTLYFSDPFNEKIDPLTLDELSTVQGWLSYFIHDDTFVPDQTLFTPLLQANVPPDSLFGFSFNCEEALFGKENPCYEQFFDLQPWQAPLFAIARINAQYSLRGQIGFDLTQRAIQEAAPPLDITWAFIQDAMRLAPFAIRRAIPTLLQCSSESLLTKWVEHALLYNKELAPALLRYSSQLPPEKQFSILQKLLKDNGSPLFDEAVCALTCQVQQETLLQEPKMVLDLASWLVAHKRLDVCGSLLNQIALLKAFNKAVCTKKEKDKIPYYFLYRGAFATDDATLVEEDIKALALFPVNTAVPCFKNVLEIALLRAKEKVPEILEKAVDEESSLWKKVYELKQRTKPFTAKDCCHVINACGPHFSANGDDESLLFWVKTLLDCLKKEKKSAADPLKKEIILECIKHIKDPAIFSHNELTKLLSKNELQQVYAGFLQGLFERADKEAIALYLKFFPKLALNSPEEQNVTRLFIALLCSEIESSEAFLDTLFNLAKSVLISRSHTDLASEGAEVLLYYPDMGFPSTLAKNNMITKHVNLESLKAWKERFFEIACGLMHALLDAPSKSEQENDLRLEIVAHMLVHITKGNERRKKLPPIFEKMVFSPLSHCSADVYYNNILRARDFYFPAFALGFFTSYPHSHYKTRLVIGTDECEKVALRPEEKILLFNEALDFQINTKLPKALHNICSIMRNSSLSIFGKDDEMRTQAIVKIIQAVLAMPYARISAGTGGESVPLVTSLLLCIVGPDWNRQQITYDEKHAAKKGYPIVKMLIDQLATQAEDAPVSHDEFVNTIRACLVIVTENHLFESEAQYVDLLKAYITTPLLQKILNLQDWEDYVNDLFRLLTQPNPQEERCNLFRQCTLDLLKSDDKKIFDKGMEFLREGMNEGLYRGQILDDHDLCGLLNPSAPSPSLEGTLLLAINTNLPELRKKAIALYQESFPKRTRKSPEEQQVTQLFIALLCKEIDTVESFFENIGDLGSSVLAALGCPDLNPIDTLLCCEDKSIVLNPNLDHWKERFFEIACDILHTLLDAPAQSENENAVRLEIVAQLIGYILRGNPRRNLVIPIFEKMVFSHLSTCSPELYNYNVQNAMLLYNNMIEPLNLSAEYPSIFYKMIFIIHGGVWVDNPLKPQKKLALFNEVLDFQIRANQPLALYIMCCIMTSSSLSIFGEDDELRIGALLKLIDAAFAMPYARVNDLPLIVFLISCILSDERQLIAIDNEDAAVKGYPLMKKLTDKLVALCIKEDVFEEFVDILLKFWQQVAHYRIFESEVQYVDLLKVATDTPMLQKILKSEYWNENVTFYFNLLTTPNPQKERINLFRQFIMELLKSNDKEIFDRGRVLFLEGTKKGVYPGKIVDDPDLWDLFKRDVPI